MDKNENNSRAQADKLMYLPATHVAHEMGRQRMKEQGFIKSCATVFWPAFKENPFIFIGVPCILFALGASFYHEMKGNKTKAIKMLEYKAYFGMFTFCAFAGGWIMRDRKAKQLKDEQRAMMQERYRTMFESDQSSED